MKAELTIRGDVEVLRLEPGDKIIATIDTARGITPDDVTTVKEALEDEFEGHEVVVLYGLRLARAAA